MKPAEDGKRVRSALQQQRIYAECQDLRSMTGQKNRVKRKNNKNQIIIPSEKVYFFGFSISSIVISIIFNLKKMSIISHLKKYTLPNRKLNTEL